MNNLAKKISSIAFLVLGFIPVLLVLFFDLKLELVHERMKQKFKQQQLQTIVVHESEIKWINSTEAWINNQLFDIHNFTLNDRFYSLTGLFDEEETDLFNQKQKNDETGSEESQLLEDLLDWIQSPCHVKLQQGFLTMMNDKEFFIFHASSFNGLPRKVPTPPPQPALHIPV